MKIFSYLTSAFILGGLILPATARIQLVTLPDRDSTTLTIYNSADITMVRDRRTLTLSKGINRLEFSWANTLIDPTSIDFQPVNHKDKVRVVDVRFPPRVTNLLEWRIESDIAGEVEVEIRYFTSGISWSADYVVELNESEDAMNLSGYVKINNQSGEDYDNAQIQLVVGVINLVDEIAELARRGRPGPDIVLPQSKRLSAPPAEMSMAFDSAVGMATRSRFEAKEIVKEGLSEYFLYTIDGRDTIPHGWSKRLPSFSTPDVSVVSYYKYQSDRTGPDAFRFLKFTNDKKSKLGIEPLPDGVFNAFRSYRDSKQWEFIGSSGMKYIPIGEEVELSLGADPEILVGSTLMDFKKTDILFDTNGNVAGWTIVEEWLIEFMNAKNTPAIIDLRRSVFGDWSIESSPVHELHDANTIKLVRSLKPGQREAWRHTITTRHGTAARK
ncbi:MAG TPA: DUF4139 domain-containing protein [Kiritimatiellia bacterium]|nr:DUF4139 domain-containing protein [Kiritimatiellia bacterium]